MPTGQSTTQGVSTDGLARSLTESSFVHILTRPSAEQLAASATLLAATSTPGHVRVLDGRTAPPSVSEGLVITTDPRGDEATTFLGDEPLHRAVAVVEGLSGAVPEPVRALEGEEFTPSPGIVTPVDDLGTAIATSLRLYGPLSGRRPEAVAERLRDAGLPTAIDEARTDEGAGRRLAGWLAASALEAEDRPPSAADALESALSPIHLPHGPVPTREGLVDLLETVAWEDPGIALACLLGDGRWDAAIGRYVYLANRVYEVVGTRPTNGPDDLVSTTVDDVPPGPTARLWTAYRLHRSYGLVVSGGEPARVGLAATGPRGASALLEAATGELGGSFWGGRKVAEGLLPADPETIESTLRRRI